MSELDTLFDTFDQEETKVQAPAATAVAPPTTKQPEEKYAKSMIFVRGIPKDASNQELEEFFSNIGPVRSCFVVGEKVDAPEGEETTEADAEKKTDEDKKEAKPAKPVSVTNRGFGFVQYVLAEDAARAIEELSETKFRNKKRLMLDFAMKKHARDAEDGDNKPSGKRPRPEPKKVEEQKQKLKEKKETLATAASEDGQPKKPKFNSGTKVVSRSIIIKGIPAGVTKQQLIKKVKKSGNPHSVVYPVAFSGATADQLKDGAGGIAHVTYDDHAMAQKAARSLHDHIFKGVKLDAKLKTEYIDKNARLIVRNLPFKVRERELEHMFSECGTVLEVDLPRKFTGGPLRGFAFIQMGDYESGERAVAKWNNNDYQGRSISVAFALAKDRFKELEEKGEVEKQAFEIAAEADEDVAMESDAAEEDDDVEMESGVEVMSDDGASDKEDMDSDENESGFEDDDEEDDDVIDESLQEGCTLFIRNLSFDSDEDGLFEMFRSFGKLRYTRIVNDNQTGKSRGTAFVCFWNSADAIKCLEAATKAQELSEKLGSVPVSKVSDKRNKSILLQETSGAVDSTSQFVLDGRMLSVTKAVDRNTAHGLATEGLEKRNGKDKRNAYLLKEGVVFPETPAAALMAPTDLEHHMKEYSVRKNQIYKNPNLYMSMTRLTVHNIPRTIDEAGLRSAAVSAISKFKQEIKDNKRKALSAEEMANGWDKRPHLSQVKIVRSSDRVDANTGKSRSLGYGFIEFTTHAHALACLRYLNFLNTRQAFSKTSLGEEEPENNKNKSAHEISRRSLRVMFAIENAQIIKKRELRSTIATKHRSMKADAAAAGDDDDERSDSRGGRGGRGGFGDSRGGSRGGRGGFGDSRGGRGGRGGFGDSRGGSRGGRGGFGDSHGGSRGGRGGFGDSRGGRGGRGGSRGGFGDSRGGSRGGRGGFSRGRGNNRPFGTGRQDTKGKQTNRSKETQGNFSKRH
ncbi:RNA recognition motif-containing protein [Kickxella alabastrina]|uniref:RNA recognition motif-containing protein n=1 Tax=Kickxella alabastrina TaxID=61397 RepID=A0ACC1I947_9FUNG|nr:RNA recognition motif-containing protein [Kickxella alabastrina]